MSLKEFFLAALIAVLVSKAIVLNWSQGKHWF